MKASSKNSCFIVLVLGVPPSAVSSGLSARLPLAHRTEAGKVSSILSLHFSLQIRAATVKSGPFVKERKARHIKPEGTPLHIQPRGVARQRDRDTARDTAERQAEEWETDVDASVFEVVERTRHLSNTDSSSSLTTVPTQ